MKELHERTTAEVVEHHNHFLQSGDLEETLLDYDENSVIINMGGVVKGMDAIRAFFEDDINNCFPPETTYETLQYYVHDDLGYVVWTAESPFYSVPYGTDTFYVKNGKILRQTFAGILNAKK